jgi:hypothetical protein
MTLYHCRMPFLEGMAEAFHDPRPQVRVADFGLGLLCADKPKTVTSALIWLEQQHQDWSASFHLLSHDVWSMHDLFDPLLEGALRLHPDPSIPVSFLHTPPLKAPPRSSEQVKKQIKEARRKYTQSHAALGELLALRQRLDRLGPRDRLLLNSVDGSFAANKNYLRDLPPRTVVVARIRKDAKLRAYLPPELRHGPRKYADVI